MSLNPQETYVLLSADGNAASLRGGEHFFALPEVDLAQAGAGWLVSEYCFSADWPRWEMHPDGDEFVYLLSGAAQLHLQYPAGLSIVELTGSGAVIVPRGIWHTAKIDLPSRMLHITRGAGTQTRPVQAR